MLMCTACHPERSELANGVEGSLAAGIPDRDPSTSLVPRFGRDDIGVEQASRSAGRCPRQTVAVATDVGAWRVLRPVLVELERRGRPCQVMLAGPAASIAGQDGVAYQRLKDATV